SGGDGNQLSVSDRNRRCDDVMGEKGEDSKRPEDADEASGNRSDRGWLGDEKPCPGIEKSSEWAIGVAHVNVLAAGLWFHGAKFGIGERAEERKQSADDPRQINQPGGTDRLHHFGGYQENTAADDGADHDRSGVAYTEIPQPVRLGGRGGYGHVAGEYTWNEWVFTTESRRRKFYLRSPCLCHSVVQPFMAFLRTRRLSFCCMHCQQADRVPHGERHGCPEQHVPRPGDARVQPDIDFGGEAAEHADHRPPLRRATSQDAK